MISIEDFFKLYPNTLTAISTLGTWLAVLVSLWLARGSYRPKLKSYAGIKNLFTADIQGNYSKTKDRIIGITIQNIGPTAVYISYWGFQWELPFVKKISAQQNPVTKFKDGIISLNVGESVAITLTEDIPKLRADLKLLFNTYPNFLHSFISLKVSTANGYKFKIKLSKELIAEILKNDA